jgi:hypothetical protein
VFVLSCPLSDRPFSLFDYAALESHVGRIVKEKQVFERLVLTKEQAADMFQVAGVSALLFVGDNGWVGGWVAGSSCEWS